MQRTSVVQSMNVLSNSFSSVLQIGDSNEITPTSRALAVQREKEMFYTNEGDFKLFPLFQQPIPLPPIRERVQIRRMNTNPYIQAHTIQMYGASNSSIVQIGSTHLIKAEGRVKHIRQLEKGRNP